MNKWNRDLLNKYCRHYNVGIIGFLQASSLPSVKNKENPTLLKKLGALPLFIQPHHRLENYQLCSNGNLLRIGRAGATSLGTVSETDWLVFHWFENESKNSYISVSKAKPSSLHLDNYEFDSNTNLSDFFNMSTLKSAQYERSLLTTVVQDNGSFDGIRRVIFGNNLNYWPHKMIFLDALSHLSNGKLKLPLQRYLQIDIDDIFVGERGTRLTKIDVEALIQFQHRLQSFIPGFQFSLGFSGKFFHRGYSYENQGDDFILGKSSKFLTVFVFELFLNFTENSSKFRWFCHMFSHSQAHLTNNISHIENELVANQNFAKV